MPKICLHWKTAENKLSKRSEIKKSIYRALIYTDAYQLSPSSQVKTLHELPKVPIHAAAGKSDSDLPLNAVARPAIFFHKRTKRFSLFCDADPWIIQYGELYQFYFYNFNSENTDNDESTSTDFDSLKNSLKLIKWDNKDSDGTITIPYELSKQFRYQFREDIVNSITDINSKLEGCIQLRFVQPNKV